MDLSWCIICDRHCTDNDLYCSDLCRFQDNNGQHSIQHNNNKSPFTMTDSSSMISKSNTSTISPCSSPILTPFLYSFQSSYDRRRYPTTSTTTTTIMTHHYFQYSYTSTGSSVSSFFDADDT